MSQAKDWGADFGEKEMTVEVLSGSTSPPI